MFFDKKSHSFNLLKSLRISQKSLFQKDVEQTLRSFTFFKQANFYHIETIAAEPWLGTVAALKPILRVIKGYLEMRNCIKQALK